MRGLAEGFALLFVRSLGTGVERGGQYEFIDQRGEALHALWSNGRSACSDPGLGSEDNLRPALGDGAIDMIRCPLDRGRKDWSRRCKIEPALLLLPGAYELCVAMAAGAHQSRADGGDPNALVAQLSMQSLGETYEREFTGRVRKHVRHCDLATDGADVDDRGNLAGIAIEHMRKRCLSNVEGREEVGIHSSVIRLDGLVFDGTYLHDSGVVDQHVDSSEVPDGVLDEACGLSLIGEISRNEEHVFRRTDRPALQQAVARLVQFMNIAGSKDEPVAFLGETFCNRESKSAGASRDKDDAIFRASRPSSPAILIAKGERGRSDGCGSAKDGKKMSSLHRDRVQLQRDSTPVAVKIL